ncbi:M20 family metallopeptidase [Pyramidobacter sp.]|uniref:M20 metallopeptidase family protein n=1 Tax=Pyramidobacter sp. TaxID=1943581 RepID=UPI002A7FC4D3|nr:M20 family metallopeptidase [Pyramidobacter sp.]
MWEKCQSLQNDLVALRRRFHQIPELGEDLPETQALLCAELDTMGIPYKKNTLDSGVVALIEGGRPGKVIALRADMDGLPITEATGLPFASRHEGRMHACGHDTHITMLLGAAKVLNEHKADLKGTVKLIFQTGEETCTGSQIMLKEGVMENPHVDAVFGMHIGTIIDPNIPAGKVIVTPGCCMASYDHFVLRVAGKGCHGSTPEKGVDPIVVASNIVLALEEIVAREVPSTKAAVVTIGRIHGGIAYNAIPGEVEIEGTTRALEEDVRRYLGKRIGEIAAGIAASYRAECKYEMIWGAAPVVNDDEMARLAAGAAVKVLGEDGVVTSIPAPNMGGEDFAFYLRERPGAFMFLSSSNHEKHTDGPHHNPHFDVDEDVFWKGSAVFVSIVEDYLGR